MRATYASIYDLKSYYRNSHSIIIGISAYKEETPLDTARNDAKSINEVLTRKYKFRNIIEPIFDEEATREELGYIFEDIVRDESKIETGDRLLIFYSGHGKIRPEINQEGVEIKQGYIVPYDGRKDKYSSCISMDSIRDNCRRCKAKHILLILDCCYAGLITRSSEGRPTPRKANGIYLDDIAKRRTLQIFAASQEDQPIADSGVRPGHSAFTDTLLDILDSGRDIDGNGILTAGEIGPYLEQEVPHRTELFQRPAYIQDTATGTGDFLFKIDKDNLSQSDIKIGEQSYPIPGRISNSPIYQNDYFFENLHIFSAHNEVLGKGTAKIAIITVGLADEKHDGIRHIKISQNKNLRHKKKYIDSIKGLEDYSTSLCALLSCPLLENNFIGIAPGSKLLVHPLYRAFGGKLFWSGLLSAMSQAAKSRPKVILLAIGSDKPPPLWIKNIIDNTVESGITVICPVGNNGNSKPTYPANYESVLSVAALASDDSKAAFSNYGRGVDICSYGTGIMTAVSNNKWDIRAGTTYSSCFVAGTVALMYSIRPELKPHEVREIIQRSADNIDYKNPNYVGQLGAGKLNVYRALIETREKRDSLSPE